MPASPLILDIIGPFVGLERLTRLVCDITQYKLLEAAAASPNLKMLKLSLSADAADPDPDTDSDAGPDAGNDAFFIRCSLEALAGRSTAMWPSPR
jgi:hypothetical protein